MRIFRRSPSSRPEPDPGDEVRCAVSSVVFMPEGTPPGWADRRAQLRRIVAEAVVLQDQAVELLADIRDGEPLAEMAARGGPLSRRFFALRRELSAPASGELARQCETAGVVLDHHGTMIAYALELLAAAWSSPAIVAQLERLDGLGAPAERLDALYCELMH